MLLFAYVIQINFVELVNGMSVFAKAVEFGFYRRQHDSHVAADVELFLCPHQSRDYASKLKR